MLREVDWTDDDGRRWRVLLPERVPDTDARRGVPVGPPDLRPLGLPHDVEVRLHNQLFARGLFTMRDVRARSGDVQSAVASAMRLSAQRVIALFEDPPEVVEADVAPPEPEREPKPDLYEVETRGPQFTGPLAPDDPVR